MRKLIGLLGGVATVLLLVIRLGAADDGNDRASGRDAGDKALARIDHIVVIYQENWSFDSLFGKFPGANGTANAVDGAGNLLIPQVDKSGIPLATLPVVKGPNGQPDPRFPTNLPPRPYDSVPFLSQD